MLELKELFKTLDVQVVLNHLTWCSHLVGFERGLMSTKISCDDFKLSKLTSTLKLRPDHNSLGTKVVILKLYIYIYNN